jgi:tRNA-binding protein
MNKLSWNDFEKIDMRVGTIIHIEDFPESKNPAYKLTINFGKKIGVKKSSAQITALYKKEDLINKQVIAVINFPKKQIANFMSECLVLGAVQGKEVSIIQPNLEVANGLRIF